MHTLTEYEAKLLVESALLEHTKALFKRIEKMRDTEREKLENHPQLNDEDIRKDFRFGLGFTQALNEVLNIPNMARDFLNNTENRQ